MIRIMLVCGLFLVATGVHAQSRIFWLEDLPDKVDSGVSAREYCANKARLSVSQAKAEKAPLEAQRQLMQWVAVACSLDIIEEAKRTAKP